MTTRIRTLGLSLGLAVIFAVADQTIKRLVMGSLSLGESHILVPGLLTITHRQNSGVAFSLLHDAPSSVLLALNLLVIGLLLYMIWPHLEQRIGMAAAGLVLGGALGNLIDRIVRHAVVDYLEVHVTTAYTWPTFNLADACVVLGVALLAIMSLRSMTAHPVPAKEEPR